MDGKTIAIVGGGFSGTMTAVNLVRLSKRPLRVVLINHQHPLGRGLAFGTNRGEHVLNVAARNMSAVPDHPNHFLDWLRTRVDYADLPDPQLREMFVPRRVYGDYLRSLLLHYMRPIDNQQSAEIQIIEDEAVDITPQDDGFSEVRLGSGETLLADRVLLATGNQPPAAIAPAGQPFNHPAYCPDPWTDWHQRLPDPAKDIVVLGTGLTMVDVFLTLSEVGWQGNIIAVSRNGMIPQAHFRGIEYPDFLPPEPETLGLKAMVALIERHCDQLRRIGENPGIIVDRLRPHTQRIWRKLSLEEKRDFLEGYAPRWNVIRHRIAQPIHQRLTEALTTGQLRVMSGTIERLSGSDEQVTVTFQNKAGEQRSLEAGMIINCTGPYAGFSETSVPLFQNLLQRGLIRPDDLDMGIEVGPDFAVIDGDGKNSTILFAIGPLMKGTLWETTAVPELRGQAMRVAEVMIEVASEAGHDYRLSVEDEHVIEYYI